jgi:flavin reductase (DIM6/NTAB) family NADH-FMN oxidoreductase RutF
LDDKIRSLAPPEHLTPELFRRACGQFATGIAILTTVDANGQPHGMTINSFTSLSLDPPLVMAAIARTSNLLAIFEATGYYAINILAANQKELSDRFARRIDNRFEGLEWQPGQSGVPLFSGALATFECRTVQVVSAGDHRVFIGEVESVMIQYREAEGSSKPLLFFRGRYAEIE